MSNELVSYVVFLWPLPSHVTFRRRLNIGD